MGSNITVYFAVSKYGDCMYLHEKFTNEDKIAANQSKLIDIIDDYKNLEEELAWDKLIQNQKPKEAGLYAAIVQYVQTAEDDFRLDVISCTPVHTFKGVEIAEVTNND